jgi:hypothetical protein
VDKSRNGERRGQIGRDVGTLEERVMSCEIGNGSRQSAQALSGKGWQKTKRSFC